MRQVLVDAGPLVALVNPRDQWHRWVKAQMEQMVPPLMTCESVLSEACFLTRGAAGGADAILNLVDRKVVAIDFSLADHFQEVARLIRQYADVPMSVADACLVRMSELISESTVLTLDNDFRIYRRHGRQKIPMRMPQRA